MFAVRRSRRVGFADAFDSAPWGLQAGHACPLFFILCSVRSSRVVCRGQSRGTANPDAYLWGARYVIYQIPQFQQRKRFCTSCPRSIFSVVAADANYFVLHGWRGELRIDGGCARYYGRGGHCVERPACHCYGFRRTLNIGSEKLPRR